MSQVFKALMTDKISGGKDTGKGKILEAPGDFTSLSHKQKLTQPPGHDTDKDSIRSQAEVKHDPRPTILRAHKPQSQAEAEAHAIPTK
uniref:Death-associated protein n=1 Tax=Steinernema glaseri TaxID=37863 RepID=A0A1I7YC64_9BILA